MRWLLSHTFLFVLGYCYHDFKIERNVQIVGDRTLVSNTVNGKVLGPVIRVKKGDILSVMVTNQLKDHGISLHWHGLEMRQSQVFDGVVGLTQCAIGPGESYLYSFKIRDEPGTYWWHTHSDMMPSGHDFIKGPLIIYPESKNLSESTSTYKYEQENERILFYQDLYPNYMGYDHPQAMGGLGIEPDRDIEGFHSGAIGWTSGLLNGQGSEKHQVNVENGEYLFRIINGGGIFPYLFSIDGYKLTVVGTDGSAVEPYETDIIQVHTGERYDFKIKFQITQPLQTVWIRAETPSNINKKGIYGVLVISNDAEHTPSVKPRPLTVPFDRETATILNCYLYDKEATNCKSVTNLKALKQLPQLDAEIHTADFLFQFVPQYAHLFSIDQGTWKQNVLPKKAMIMDSFDISRDLHPNAIVLDLQLNKSVTLIIRSVTAFPHPFHLHGHKFEVVQLFTRSTLTCPDGRCDLLDLSLFSGLENRHSTNGVLKDTVIVPVGGAAVIRFNTDNPGLWFMHCHLDQHMEDGQGFIINEGNFREDRFPGDYPSCNYEGRLQHLQTANCDCYENINLNARWRMKSSYKCSRPHLCRHVNKPIKRNNSPESTPVSYIMFILFGLLYAFQDS